MTKFHNHRQPKTVTTTTNVPISTPVCNCDREYVVLDHSKTNIEKPVNTWQSSSAMQCVRWRKCARTTAVAPPTNADATSVVRSSVFIHLSKANWTTFTNVRKAPASKKCTVKNNQHLETETIYYQSRNGDRVAESNRRQWCVSRQTATHRNSPASTLRRRLCNANETANRPGWCLEITAPRMHDSSTDRRTIATLKLRMFNIPYK